MLSMQYVSGNQYRARNGNRHRLQAQARFSCMHARAQRTQEQMMLPKQERGQEWCWREIQSSPRYDS